MTPIHPKMENSRDTATLFILRMFGRMCDIMSEKAIELEFNRITELRHVYTAIKDLKQAIVEALEP